jgi:hypothetical protein
LLALQQSLTCNVGKGGGRAGLCDMQEPAIASIRHVDTKKLAEKPCRR